MMHLQCNVSLLKNVSLVGFIEFFCFALYLSTCSFQKILGRLGGIENNIEKNLNYVYLLLQDCSLTLIREVFFVVKIDNTA